MYYYYTYYYLFYLNVFLIDTIWVFIKTFNTF